MYKYHKWVKKFALVALHIPPFSLIRNGGGNFTYRMKSQLEKEVNRIQKNMLPKSTACVILPYRTRKGAVTNGC